MSIDKRSDSQMKVRSLLPKWREAIAQDDASKFEVARRLYLEFIGECSGALSAYNNLAVLDLFEGNLTRAREYAEKATQYIYIGGQITLGSVIAYQGHLAEAVEVYKHEGSDRKDALTNLCRVYTLESVS
jgi:hypothetical protein